MPIILATCEAERRRIVIHHQSWQIVPEIPYSKKNQQRKWTGGMAQEVNCLSGKHKALSSNSMTLPDPIPQKKEKGKKKKSQHGISFV
jgi:hypothetical protein